jgi:hypothetical protein
MNIRGCAVSVVSVVQGGEERQELVENYFGRVCSLWNCMSVTWKWSEHFYDQTSRLCFALTNYHVSRHPLRDADFEHYQAVKSRYDSMAEERKHRKNRNQANYRRRRRQVLSSDRLKMNKLRRWTKHWQRKKQNVLVRVKT